MLVVNCELIDCNFSKASLINFEPNVLQDFLYLSGILEPDSALVLYGKGRPDQAVLFVPRRDPGRELWDGPRSGKDGAAALTGIERVHSTEELGIMLKSLKGGWMEETSLQRTKVTVITGIFINLNLYCKKNVEIFIP